MLLSVYNTVQWTENEWIWSLLANGFSTNKQLGARQEVIIVISFEKKKETIIVQNRKKML